MAEYTVEYTTKIERLQAIKDAEDQGHRMRHDDFDVGLVEKHLLIFEDDPKSLEPLPTADELEMKALKTSLLLSPTSEDIVRFMELEGRLG